MESASPRRPTSSRKRSTASSVSSGVSLLSRPAGRRADVALLEADPVLADLLVEAVRAGGLRLVLEGETP